MLMIALQMLSFKMCLFCVEENVLPFFIFCRLINRLPFQLTREIDVTSLNAKKITIGKFYVRKISAPTKNETKCSISSYIVKEIMKL